MIKRNTTLGIALLVGLMAGTSSPAKASDLLVLATSLCEYTKIDDRNEIRKRLKKAGVKLRRIYDDIQCDGMSLYEYAKANKAAEVQAYYEKKAAKYI